METLLGINEKQEIQDILEKQRVINELLLSNSESIKQIENEIREMKVKAGEPPKSEEKEKDQEKDKASEIKKCRYKNKGFCKYKVMCRYFHPNTICKTHIETQKCNLKGCRERHPKVCKWYNRETGCRRQDCDFLHVTLASDKHVANVNGNSFECAGCKNIWQDENCVVKHNIKNTDIFMCLNCDDWIMDKESVLKSDWTLFDQHGNLRQDV